MKLSTQIKPATVINNYLVQFVEAFSCRQSEGVWKNTQALLHVLAMGDQEIARDEFRDIRVAFEAFDDFQSTDL